MIKKINPMVLANETRMRIRIWHHTVAVAARASSVSSTSCTPWSPILLRDSPFISGIAVCNLFENILDQIDPVRSRQLLDQVTNNFPIIPGLSRRLGGPVQTLQPALDIDHRAALLRESGSGKQHASRCVSFRSAGCR